MCALLLSKVPQLWINACVVTLITYDKKGDRLQLQGHEFAECGREGVREASHKENRTENRECHPGGAVRL